jgi:hypothetical protein
MKVSAHWHETCDAQPDWTGRYQGVVYCGGEGRYVQELASWGIVSDLMEVPSLTITIPLLFGDTYSLQQVRDYGSSHWGTTWALLLEPNEKAGDDLTPREGAERYALLTEVIKSVDPDPRLLCCGVSQNAAMIWEDAFLAEYEAMFGEPPQVDGWRTHYYPEAQGFADVATYVQRLQDHVMAYKAWAGDEKVWLTEWGVIHDEGKAIQFIGQVIPWLKAQEVYFSWWCTILTTWYDAEVDLIDPEGGGLTPVGEAYAEQSE